MPRLWTNNAATTLQTTINNSVTSVVVPSGKGALFPSPTSPDFFVITVDDGTNIECMKCTSRSSDTLTVVRGYDNTTANAFTAGTTCRVELRIPADALGHFHNTDANNSEWASGSDPSTSPAAGNLFVWSKKIAGRALLKSKPSDGWDTPYQPAFFSNWFIMATPNTTTSMNVIACSLTSVGTLSTPTPAIGQGAYTNFVSGASANNTAGTGTALLDFARGNTTGQVNGFFYAARLYLPDASYGSGATGARFFAGLCSGTMASTVGADDPAAHHCGFTYSTNAGNTAFQFSTKDNTTQNTNTTSMTWTVQHSYDFYIYCAPQGSTIYWRVDDLTASTTQEGSTSTNLPGATTMLRSGFQISTLTTVARNIGCKRLYTETQL